MKKGLITFFTLLLPAISNAAATYNISGSLSSTQTYGFPDDYGIYPVSTNALISGQLTLYQDTYTINLNVGSRSFSYPGGEAVDYSAFTVSYTGEYKLVDTYYSDSYYYYDFDDIFHSTDYYRNIFGVDFRDFNAQTYTQVYWPIQIEGNSEVELGLDDPIVTYSSEDRYVCVESECSTQVGGVYQLDDPEVPEYSALDIHYGYGVSGEIVDTYFVTFSEVTPVPVPAAFWLFGSALISLIACKRK
ncbi:MAG: hypothetical protein ACN2B6_12725 [Rickettsiales bacterium]